MAKTATRQDTSKARRELEARAPATTLLARSAHLRIDRLVRTAAPFEHAARSNTGDAASALEENGRETLARATRAVDESPLLALGVAFGGGFLFSRLSRRIVR